MLENYWHLGSIYLSLPHAKVLHMWREPVQACFSAYATLFSQGSNAVPYSYDLIDLAAYHRVYDGAMAFWREALPSHFLLTVNYTELVLSPEAALHRVVDFVGLPGTRRSVPRLPFIARPRAHGERAQREGAGAFALTRQLEGVRGGASAAG